jgi:hypothetical protein
VSPTPREVPRWAGVLALKRHALVSGELLALGPDDANTSSNYGTADFTALAGISEGLAGFVVGLFSMTAADWCFRA